MGCGGSAAKKYEEPAEATGFIARLIDNPGKIDSFYEFGKKKLGEGSYGFVTKATHLDTKISRAIKVIPKKGDMEKVKHETELMKRLDHPNICKLYEAFKDAKYIYLVLELCEGGELFDRICDLVTFSEPQTAIVVQQMVRAVYYMHEIQLTHRDLKPENFLFTTKDPIEKSTLKLIDFGLARGYKEDEVLTTQAGTPFYVAPEVLQGKYDQRADNWSIGVILYVMLCGYPPFNGDSDREILERVKQGHATYPREDWEDISDDAKVLVKSLITKDYVKRFTAKQALEHVWIRDTAPAAKDVDLGTGFVDKLRKFRSANKLKKAALHVIANQMSDEQLGELKQIFAALDDNGDGLLSAEELKAGLQKANLQEIPADLQQILDGIDADGSGVIDYTEFLAATLEKKNYDNRQVYWQAFRKFDRDGNGKLDKQEIEQVLLDGQISVNDNKDLAQLIAEIDINGDGEIDFEEFVAMMKG